MSTRVSVRGRQLLVDGRPVFLRSAEIQYFRIPRDQWEDRILAAKQAGHNCIASYIVWGWHEFEEGRFDFTGETVPERDLVGFLNLVEQAGLYFFARVGPFVNAELMRGGHPAWLFERYPELQSRDARGEYAHRPNDGDLVPSQLKPEYLSMVDRWYTRLAEVLAPRTLDRGGPVILVQPDNEPNLVFTYGVEGSLYDPHVIGDDGLWPQWVKARYGEAWPRRYQGLTDGRRVPVPRRGEASSPAEYRLVADWLRFKQWHVFEYLRRLARRLRELGLDLPFTVNEPLNRYWSWYSGEHGAFARFMEDAGETFFTNGHCYLNYGGQQDARGAPITLARIESVKASRLAGPPSIFELGSWYLLPQGNLAPSNWDVMTKLLIGSGMNGYSVYVYAGGRTPPGWGKIGPDYDWPTTCIAADGTRARSYFILAEINRFVTAWERPILEARKLYDVTIGLLPELGALARHVQLPAGFAGLPGDTTALVRDVFNSLPDLFRVLANLSVNFELTSFAAPDREPGPATGLLVVPNHGAVDREAADFIVRHLRAGGDALFYPVVPAVDADGEPLPALAELAGQRIVGFTPRGGHRAGDLASRFIDGQHEREVGFDTPVVYFAAPADAQVLATHRGAVAAYRRAAGGGHVTVMGFLPVYWSSATQRLFEEVFVEATGMRRVAEADDRGVLVLARRHPDGPTLVTVASIGGDACATHVTVETAGGRLRFPVDGALELGPHEARFLWVDLPLPEARLVYTTSQLVPGQSPGEYLASGADGTAGQMAFDRPVRAAVQGQPAEVVRRGGVWVLSYRHGREPVAIRLG